jgi:hypothetical protein
VKSIEQINNFGAIDADNDTLLLDSFEDHEARGEYSDYLWNELDDEIYKHISYYKNCMDIIRSIGQWHFSLDEFSKQYNSKFANGDVDAQKALSALYNFSIIGFYRPGGRGYGGSEYVFKYKEPRTLFDATAARFRVHAGLIDVLGLKTRAC